MNSKKTGKKRKCHEMRLLESIDFPNIEPATKKFKLNYDPMDLLAEDDFEMKSPYFIAKYFSNSYKFTVLFSIEEINFIDEEILKLEDGNIAKIEVHNNFSDILNFDKLNSVYNFSKNQNKFEFYRSSDKNNFSLEIDPNFEYSEILNENSPIKLTGINSNNIFECTPKKLFKHNFESKNTKNTMWDYIKGRRVIKTKYDPKKDHLPSNENNFSSSINKNVFRVEHHNLDLPNINIETSSAFKTEIDENKTVCAKIKPKKDPNEEEKETDLSIDDDKRGKLNFHKTKIEKSSNEINIVPEQINDDSNLLSETYMTGTNITNTRDKKDERIRLTKDMLSRTQSDLMSSLNFEFIREILKKNKFKISIKKLKKIYEEKYPTTHMCLESYRKIMRNYFNLKYKKVRTLNFFDYSVEFHEERYIFLKLILKIFMNKYQVVFIDESCFTTHYDRKYSWYNNSEEFRNTTEIIGKLQNHQLIVASTLDNIIYWKIFPGYNNSDTFKNFLEEMLIRVRRNFGEEKKIFYFLDGAYVHDNKKIIAFFRNENIKLLWGVRNYSLFDFSEYLFQKVKVAHYKNIYRTE